MISPTAYPEPVPEAKVTSATPSTSLLASLTVKEGTELSPVSSILSSASSTCRSIAALAKANIVSNEVPTIRAPIPTEAPISPLHRGLRLRLCPPCGYQRREREQVLVG